MRVSFERAVFRPIRFLETRFGPFLGSRNLENRCAATVFEVFWGVGCRCIVVFYPIFPHARKVSNIFIYMNGG